MLGRCRYKGNNRYKNYGGRGIAVCERWKKFENFFEDMGEKPKNKSLERKDNDGNYCKENCKWATNKEQARNRTTNVFVMYNGKKYIITDLAKKLHISHSSIKKRLALGLPITERVRQSKNSRLVDLSKFLFSEDRDSDIVRLRKDGCTLHQIGSVFGISRERVRQVLNEKNNRA